MTLVLCSRGHVFWWEMVVSSGPPSDRCPCGGEARVATDEERASMILGGVYAVSAINPPPWQR